MVKAENVYSAEHFKAANSTSIKGKRTYAAVAILLIAIVILGGSAISGFLKALDEGRTSDAVIMEISAICVVWFGLGIVKSLVNRNSVFEKAAKNQQMRRFDVTENELVLTVDGGIEHSERRFVLSGLHKVYDTGSFFIIYIYENMYCMIGYSDITEGTPEELRSLLYNAVGDRLTIMKSK